MGEDFLDIQYLCLYHGRTHEVTILFFPEIKEKKKNYRGDICRYSTVRPRSLDPSYIVTYYMKWVKTSWPYSIYVNTWQNEQCYPAIFTRDEREKQKRANICTVLYCLYSYSSTNIEKSKFQSYKSRQPLIIVPFSFPN